MEKTNGNISEVVAPMFAITMELDAIIGALLRDQFNMSLADFKILRAVYILGDCSQLDIARLNHVTEAAVSKRIKSLSDDGLIKKTANPGDKRTSVLSLTVKGQSLMKQLQKAVVGNTELILTDFSKTSRKLTTELLLEILGMVIKHSPRRDMLMKSKHPILEQCQNNNN